METKWPIQVSVENKTNMTDTKLSEFRMSQLHVDTKFWTQSYESAQEDSMTRKLFQTWFKLNTSLKDIHILLLNYVVSLLVCEYKQVSNRVQPLFRM